MIPKWKCLCGHLNRLKHKDVICIICRTECKVKEPSIIKRNAERADWMASDYRKLPLKSVISLVLHTDWLINQLINFDKEFQSFIDKNV